jgi:hypothetical protein
VIGVTPRATSVTVTAVFEIVHCTSCSAEPGVARLP